MNRISASRCSRLSRRTSTCALRNWKVLFIHSVRKIMMPDLAHAYARRTSIKGSLPSFEVLCNLRHLHIGVELLNLVEKRIFVVIAEVVVRLLPGRFLGDTCRNTASLRTLGFGVVPTIALSCPRVMESSPGCCCGTFPFSCGGWLFMNGGMLICVKAI